MAAISGITPAVTGSGTGLSPVTSVLNEKSVLKPDGARGLLFNLAVIVKQARHNKYRICEGTTDHGGGERKSLAKAAEGLLARNYREKIVSLANLRGYSLAFQVMQAPAPHCIEYREKFFAILCEGIFDTGRDFRKYCT
jgi:hypothetical protein